MRLNAPDLHPSTKASPRRPQNRPASRQHRTGYRLSQIRHKRPLAFSTTTHDIFNLDLHITSHIHYIHHHQIQAPSNDLPSPSPFSPSQTHNPHHNPHRLHHPPRLPIARRPHRSRTR